MPRIRDRMRFEGEPDPRLELMIGPSGRPNDWTVAELAVAWQLRGEALVYDGPAGTRPWAWWEFEAGEERPGSREAEAIRLAELGELTADELAALRERANEARLRVDTPNERISAAGSDLEQRPDRDAVELFEAVERAKAG